MSESIEQAKARAHDELKAESARLRARVAALEEAVADYLATLDDDGELDAAELRLRDLLSPAESSPAEPCAACSGTDNVPCMMCPGHPCPECRGGRKP